MLFDGRRIWSFWLHRDGEHQRRRATSCRGPRRCAASCTARRGCSVVEHVSGTVVYDEEVRLGDAASDADRRRQRPRAAAGHRQVAAARADLRHPQRRARRSRCSTRSRRCSAALQKAGIDAFPAYGTLLGAVRGGKLIGHDSDADLGYVSEHTHPVDVVRESFRLQRALADMGYRITRYSGAAFKVDVRRGRRLGARPRRLRRLPRRRQPAPDGRDPHAVPSASGSSRSAPPRSRAASCRRPRTPTSS